jgi:hypothetical protein
MGKVISIHQPNFVPWIGYFYKILQSDIFIILDNVQYSKNSFINRNRIKTPQGELWLTLPVETSGKFGQLINQCIILNKPKTTVKIIKSLELNYSKAPYFQEYICDIKEIISNSNELLCDTNIVLIKYILNILEVKTEIILASDLKNIQGASTDRLVSICKELNASKYLCGFGGVKYQDEELFKQQNIILSTTTFKHPTYSQLWGEFINGMSILDLLFNCGSKAKDILSLSS